MGDNLWLSQVHHQPLASTHRPPHKVLKVSSYTDSGSKPAKGESVACRSEAGAIAVMLTNTNPPKSGNAIAEHPSGDKRFRLLEATMKRYQYQQGALIEVMHQAQELFGYLEEDLLLYIARSLKLPPSQVYGVATFYHFFSLKRKGAHTCVVCMGTACYVKGAAALLGAIETHARIQVGETTPDGELSLGTARCLGACGVAPAVVVDGVTEGHQTPEIAIARLEACLHGSS